MAVVPRPHPNGLDLQWLGHSTTLLDLDGACLLTDPLLRRRVAHLVRRHGADPAPLDPPPDVVLCSHVHPDHFDVPSLRQLPRSALVVVPRGAGRRVERLGFDKVVEVVEGDEVGAGAVSILATHAEHTAGRVVPGWGPEPVGYLLRGSMTAYFAGDTDLFEGMSALASGLDLALLPVSGWGSRVPAGHLDPQRATAALALLKPRVAVPIHWGTYRPFYRRAPYPVDDSAGERFAAFARTFTPDVDVRVLHPGDSCTIETV